MGMGIAGGFAAGAGADALTDLLKQKFMEQFQRQRLAQEQAQLAQQAEAQRVSAGIAQGHLREQQRMNDAALQPKPAPAPKALFRLVNGQPQQVGELPANGQLVPDAPAPKGPSSLDQVLTDAYTSGDPAKIKSVLGVMAQRAAATREPRQAAAGPKPSAEPVISPQQQNEVDDSLALIDQIAGDPALSTAVGPIDQYIGKAMDLPGVTRFQKLNDQLIGKLALAQAGKLRGQGQISDKERALLSAAATALSRGLSEQDYKNELAKIRMQFQRMKQPTAAAPMAAPAAAPKAGGLDVDALLKKYGGG